MSLESHIAELMERHRHLETEIEQELLRPACDDLKLAELKKRKLHLKEKIEQLTRPNAA